jgi:signal transduction histidine kinase
LADESPGVATTLLASDAAGQARARARVYVVAQSVGWGVFLGLHLLLSAAFPRGADPRPVTEVVSGIAVAALLGLLITHVSRRWFGRWGWKQLGWRALAPRLAATALVQAVVWNAISFGYTFGLYALVGQPWPFRLDPGLLFIASCLQSALVFGGWLAIYFFHHLSDRYHRLRLEQVQLAAHVKEAELRALKSQVNPHFIFNALNSLRALIDEDPARARQAVTQLANLLRYSLQAAQSETVPLEDELRVVNDYLALEQVRHEERLRVRLEIAPETLGLAVPPLLLQTLVENAVKYGISTRPEGGEIVISARCADGQLELRVINPGELRPADAMSPRGTAEKSTGLGLRNAAERLRLFFGDRARLELRAENASRVVAEVSLPMQAIRR